MRSIAWNTGWNCGGGVASSADAAIVETMSGSEWSDEKWAVTAGTFLFPPSRSQAEQASGDVSGDYFRGLEVLPAAGRLIIPDDDRVGAPAIAVLSFAFSQKRFGDAASAPGQSILINNVPFTVAGVAPPGFFGVDPTASPDFYLPLPPLLLLHPVRPQHRMDLGGGVLETT